jgi:hypothetical protein
VHDPGEEKGLAKSWPPAEMCALTRLPVRRI